MPPIDVIDLDFSGNIVPLPVRDGTSVKIEYRCMPLIKDEVARVVQEGIFNFRTASDFHRRADWNQLLLLKELSPQMKRRMRWPQLWIETIEQSENRRKHENMVMYMDREVDALKRAGDEVEARRLVLRLANLIADSGSNGDREKATMRYIRLKHLDLLSP